MPAKDLAVMKFNGLRRTVVVIIIVVVITEII